MATDHESEWVINKVGQCKNGICTHFGKCYFAATLYGPNNTGQLSSTLPRGSEGINRGVFQANQMLVAAARHDNNGCPNTRSVVKEIFSWAKSMKLPRRRMK